MRSQAFVALFVTVFVTTMGISMVSPVLPVYAKELGASGLWLGLLGSIFAVVQAAVGPFVGGLSDRHGRKTFILLGLSVYIVAAVGYLTAQSFWQVLVFRSLTGLGATLIFSPARAFVGDMTPRGQEGRWLGMFAVGDVVGFGTGPLIAGVLRQELGFRWVFVVMAGILAMAMAIVIAYVPANLPQGGIRGGMRADAVSIPLRRAIRQRLVLAMAIQGGMLWVASGAVLGLLAIRLEDDLGATPILIGVAFAMQNVTGGLAQPIWGRMADRLDRRRLVPAGLAGSAVVVILLGVVPAYWMALGLLLVLGATTSIAQVAAQAVQVVAGRSVGMGTMQGIATAGQGAGFVVGALAGGVIYGAANLQSAFVFGGCVMLVGVPVFLTLTRGLSMRETQAAMIVPAES